MVNATCVMCLYQKLKLCSGRSKGCKFYLDPVSGDPSLEHPGGLHRMPQQRLLPASWAPHLAHRRPPLGRKRRTGDPSR